MSPDSLRWLDMTGNHDSDDEDEGEELSVKSEKEKWHTE